MRLIKRLDIFILKNFLTLFAGTFCISQFVVMMQFLWKYINELVGKGLSFDVYAKFFFYAGETLVPMALPLAILLASLISFGNMGERLELLAIKASGISLLRTLRPLIILNLLFALASFHFQNKIVPEAQENLMQLLYSMRQKSPELDIPEGAFYDGIENINIYVNKKNKETGMLYDVIIYNMQDGVNKAHIILSDSAKMETSADKTHLVLHLYQGEQFENLQSDALQAKNVPYRRETFVEKHFIIDFDSNFNMADNESVTGSAFTKNMNKLTHDIDSMEAYYDSLSLVYTKEMEQNTLNIPHKARLSDYDSLAIANMSDATRKQLDKEEKAYHALMSANAPKSEISIDSLLGSLEPQGKQRVFASAMQRATFQAMDAEYKSALMESGNRDIRVHWIRYWEKITMSLACLLFFFIGAPLGAIIRKGGLGFPVVVAVIVFIVYYIINTFGTKVGREGSIPVVLGMWFSTLMLAPLGVFFTVKSNNDSAVFNMDAYVSLWRKLLGIRQKRYISKKEVIIYDPNYVEMAEVLGQLSEQSQAYLDALPHSSMFGYVGYIFRFWLSKNEDVDAENVNRLLEYTVECLSNSRDRQILHLLNDYPVMDTHSFRFYRRRKKDLKAIIQTSDTIKNYIYDKILSVQ